MYYYNRKFTFILSLLVIVLLILTFTLISPNIKLSSQLKSLFSFSPANSWYNSSSMDILEAQYNVESNELVQNLIQQDTEKTINPVDIDNIRLQDNKYYITESGGNFPYQRFVIRLSDYWKKGDPLNIAWEGRSNRIADLYAWNHTAGSWSKLQASVGRDKNNMILKAILDPESMVNNKTVTILLSAGKSDVLLPGKVPSNGEYDFTFAWLTDTQYYSVSYPEIFEKMTRFVVSKKQEKKIIYAIHTGDLIDNTDDPDQWKIANQSMAILDRAGFPYGVAAGNHDVTSDGVNYTNYYKYFGSERFSKNSYYGGSPNNNRDHFDLVSSNGTDFIIIYLGWQIQKNSLTWANEVLKQYPNHKAIIALHSYVSPRGSYLDQAKDVLREIIEPNPNVFMILSGHYQGAICNVKRSQGRVFYEILSDYQWGPQGGSGYMRLLHFDIKNNLIYFNTYSPHLKDYNFFEDNKDQFIISLPGEQRKTRIETDYLGVSR